MTVQKLKAPRADHEFVSGGTQEQLSSERTWDSHQENRSWNRTRQHFKFPVQRLRDRQLCAGDEQMDRLEEWARRGDRKRNASSVQQQTKTHREIPKRMVSESTNPQAKGMQLRRLSVGARPETLDVRQLQATSPSCGSTALTRIGYDRMKKSEMKG
ncbi:hypothetical protein K438DRAFT_2156078 [Mycena galopus ATCC 62051]|nr:hypothetical protein K438DRAFT_2156078 [Mycena galopus ATCC 62051]